VIPISVFCVEAGRSKPRGTENPREFHSSNHVGAGKNFKLAAKAQKSQDGVWGAVAENQQKLSASLGTPVTSKVSPSSFPLALGNERVIEASDPYLDALAPIVEGKDDVIGYAFAINGEVNSGDVYGSHALFLKMWPKLLRGSAIEALAEHPNAKGDQQPIAPPPTKEMVRDAIEQAATGTAEGAMAGKRTVLVTRQTATAAMFETVDPEAGDDAYVHRSFILKDPAPGPGEENGTWRRRTR
jgi:hypothetical protein